MRILIITRYCLYPSWQGSAQHARSFANALLGHGHQVHIVSGQDLPYQEQIQDGYKITCIPLAKANGMLEEFLSITAHEPKMYGYATEIIEKWQPDILHVGAFSQLGPFVETAHNFSIPVVAMMHTYGWLCLTKYLMDHAKRPCTGPENVAKCTHCVTCQLSQKRQWVSRTYQLMANLGINGFLNNNLAYQLDVESRVHEAFEYLAMLRSCVDIFIAQTPMTAMFLEEYGIPRSSIQVVGQWLVDEKRKKYKKESRTTKAKLRIGFIGRLSPEKGLGVLGQALRMLPDLSGIELWILASGGTQALLERFMGNLTEEKGLRIRLFDDFKGRETLPKTIAQLDVCVVPSTCRETGPRTLLEAMAQDVPCIASDSVGNSYLIKDNVNGCVVEAGNASALASALQEIIAAPDKLDAWRNALPKVMGGTEWLNIMLAVHEAAVTVRKMSSYETKVE